MTVPIEGSPISQLDLPKLKMPFSSFLRSVLFGASSPVRRLSLSRIGPIGFWSKSPLHNALSHHMTRGRVNLREQILVKHELQRTDFRRKAVLQMQCTVLDRASIKSKSGRTCLCLHQRKNAFSSRPGNCDDTELLDWTTTDEFIVDDRVARQSPSIATKRSPSHGYTPEVLTGLEAAKKVKLSSPKDMNRDNSLFRIMSASTTSVNASRYFDP
jgi:hypothetical protein